jgi:two-component system sensor histidine kinase YesM
MDENKVAALSEGRYVSLDDNKGTGNGILNVQNRIQLLFGDDNGLKIESNINVGTSFELTLPIRREGV